MDKTSETLFTVTDLKKYFPISGGIFSREIGQVKAVDGISFEIRKRETFGLVGESGCGKTTVGRCLLLLIKPTAGNIRYLKYDLLSLKEREMRPLRVGMSMIFQDPFSSLNPRMTVGEIIGEPLVIHGIAKGKDKKSMIRELMEKVGLSPEHFVRYPHQFSGGQKQRIGIARALATRPQFVVADEPVAALDVSVRAEILNLLKDLQKEYGLTFLYISHNLSVVKHICDRIAVMYLGKIVELDEKNELFNDPKHPYTQALISAIPIPDPTVQRKRIILRGDVSSAIKLPPGCRFHPRCIHATPKCSKEEPDLVDVGYHHYVACHY